MCCNNIDECVFFVLQCRHELKKASHITKLPKGKHSVKGQKTLVTANSYCLFGEWFGIVVFV